MNFKRVKRGQDSRSRRKKEAMGKKGSFWNQDQRRLCRQTFCSIVLLRPHSKTLAKDKTDFLAGVQEAC